MGSNQIKQINQKNTQYSLIVRTILILSTCLGLSSCQNESNSVAVEVIEPSPQLTETIVLGDISNNPAKKITRYQPMADYLAENLQEFGIGRGDVKIAPNLDTMGEWLKAGAVDIYFDSPYPAMIVSDRSGSQMLLRRWKGGQEEYYGVFITMNDRGIQSLEDLKGKIMAFDDPYSTSGYFLPVARLAESGFQLVEVKSDSATVPEDKIGYIFTGDDENIIQWVISGKVDAGVVDIDTFETIPQESRQEFTLLAKTKTVPRQMVSVRQDLDPELREKIKSILINMDRTEAGKEVLTQFEETSKFDDFPAEQSIKELKKLYKSIAE